MAPNNDRIPRLRWMAAAALAIAASTTWWFAWRDDCMPSYALLGGYSHRAFAAGFALSILALAALAHAWRPQVFRIGRFVLAGGAVGIFLILTEALAIAGLVDFSRLIPSPMKWEHDDTAEWMKPDRHVKGRTVPDLAFALGIDAPEVPFEIRTDRFGLRNPRDKEDAEIFCLGDSVLFAGLVPGDRTVTELLERDLETPVMNVSRIGLSPQESLALLEATGLPLRDRVVVHFIFEGNDLEGSRRWRAKHDVPRDAPWRGGRRIPDDRPPWPDSGFVKCAMNRLLRHRPELPERRRATFASRTGDRDVWFFYDVPTIEEDLDELVALESLLEAADRWLSEKRARFAVVFVPAKISVVGPHSRHDEGSHLRGSPERSRFGGELAEICARIGVPMYDATDALRARAAVGELPFFARDTHLSPEGHAALAAAVTPLLNRLRSNGDKR